MTSPEDGSEWTDGSDHGVMVGLARRCVVRVESHVAKILQCQVIPSVSRDVPPKAGARAPHAFEDRGDRVKLGAAHSMPINNSCGDISAGWKTTSFFPLYLDQS